VTFFLIKKKLFQSSVSCYQNYLKEFFIIALNKINFFIEIIKKINLTIPSNAQAVEVSKNRIFHLVQQIAIGGIKLQPVPGNILNKNSLRGIETNPIYALNKHGRVYIARFHELIRAPIHRIQNQLFGAEIKKERVQKRLVRAEYAFADEIRVHITNYDLFVVALGFV
jgi:hypothetical protein